MAISSKVRSRRSSSSSPHLSWHRRSVTALVAYAFPTVTAGLEHASQTAEVARLESLGAERVD